MDADDTAGIEEVAAALDRAGPGARAALTTRVLREHAALRDALAAERTPAGLARALTRAAGAHPGVARELARWMAETPASPPAPMPAPALAPALAPAPASEAPRQAPGAVARPLPVPRQLIAPPALLPGREADLAALDALRENAGPGPLVIVVNGPAGVGKTALAAYWLRGLLAGFPDGQLYADLRGHAPEGPAGPGEALGMFLRAFGMGAAPADLGEGAALWRSVTAGRRLLLMLDNAVSAAQIRPLVPGAEESVVLVTSRTRLTGLALEGAAFHPLGLLDDDAAARILARRVGAARVAAEPDAARRVVARCGGLPLALCVAAARIAARPALPLAATADAMDRGAERLTVLRAAEGEFTVRGALDASYHPLPPDAAALYRLLGALPFARFTPALAAAAAGLRLPETERLFDFLAEVSLLEETGHGRFRCHDLVRLHARGLAEAVDGAEVREAALRRALEWYLAAACAAERALSPSHTGLAREHRWPVPESAAVAGAGGERDALAWLEGELPQLTAALNSAVEHGWDALAWQLVDAMWPLFLHLRPYELWVEAHDTGLAAARRAGDRAGELRMLTSGGIGLLHAGRAGPAARWFGRALDLAREDGDDLVASQALHGLGQAHHREGRLTEAAASFREAMALRERIGYARGAALSRISLADVALSDGRPGEAAAALTRARAELLALPDVFEATRALALLGRAYAESGEDRRAAQCLREAAEEFGARGSIRWEARTREFLALAHQSADRPDDALREFERSLDLYERSGAPDAVRLANHIHTARRRGGTAST